MDRADRGDAGVPAVRHGPHRAPRGDPADQADLHPTGTQLLWIIDGYGFTVAGALVTMGTLGDRIGRRRLLMFGAAAFGAVSLLAAFSTSAEMLIAARMLLGIAGATIAPSTLSLIFHMFTDPRQRSLAIGVWIGAFSAGSAVGPVLGGLVLASHRGARSSCSRCR